MSIVKKIIILIVSFVYYMGSSFANTDIMNGLLFSPERIVYKESEKNGVSTMLENAIARQYSSSLKSLLQMKKR